ncbi:MAG: hypothetical protein IPH64_17905 [Comamonadaceae bacterium]|mgnify:CR=1 FL=1|jgi:hypothetical protein|nr:hypothetical protein [Comamonadaceae bacterium]
MDLKLLMPWIWPVLLGLMWLLVTASNIASLIEARRRGGSSSLTLFLGGLFGVLAVLALPVQGAWIWCWIPAVVDPGSLPAVVRILRHGRNDGKA